MHLRIINYTRSVLLVLSGLIFAFLGAFVYDAEHTTWPLGVACLLFSIFTMKQAFCRTELSDGGIETIRMTRTDHVEWRDVRGVLVGPDDPDGFARPIAPCLVLFDGTRTRLEGVASAWPYGLFARRKWPELLDDIERFRRAQSRRTPP